LIMRTHGFIIRLIVDHVTIDFLHNDLVTVGN
jgi:hypothetical protein